MATTKTTFATVPPAALGARTGPKEIPDTETGGVAATESAAGGPPSRGKKPPQAAAVMSPQAQRFRSGLRKGGLPIFYRICALAFSCVGFALIASTGTQSFTIGNQTFPGRKFRHYRTLNYALSSNVIVFFYSFWMIIADALRMSGRFKPTEVSKAVMPPLVLTLDFTLIFLQFGAATAIAGLRGGFSDLSLANYCSFSSIFCRKLVGSTVLSYLAWLAMAPSLYINIADNENGPW